MSAAIRERENVMHFRCRSDPTLAPAHFAQGMRHDIPAPDGWPHAVVPLLHFWCPLISVVPGGDQPFMLRAERFIGQGRAARIPTRFPWFPGHSHLHSKRAAGISARGPHPDLSMIHYMPDPMRHASDIDAVLVRQFSGASNPSFTSLMMYTARFPHTFMEHWAGCSPRGLVFPVS